MFEEWRAAAVGGADTADQPVPVPGRPAAFAGEDGVRYVTAFADPREGDDEVAVVVLRGLYARAEVDVTGDRLDGEGAVEHDTYFEPLRIPVRPFAENELSVTCHAPRDRFGGLHDTDRVSDSDSVPGIWWGASLETHPLPYIDRLQITPELTGDGAVLHVRASVVTGGPIEERITYSLKPEGETKASGMMSRGVVETSGAGRTTADHEIELRDPSLWWPRDLGDQNRYTLRAKLGDSERTVTTGIADVEREGDRFVVNGEPVPIRGVGLDTAEPADIQRAVETNANLVRARGHVLPPAVYEAANEAGMLVWQDLPLTGPGEFDTDRGADLARRLADTYGHHPSLAAFSVHDEPTAAFADGLGSGLLDSLRLRWRAWRADYDRESADEVAKAIPDTWPVFPVVGGPGIDHDAAAYYPGWDYGEAADIDSLLARYPTEILGAFGAGSVGKEVETTANFDADTHAAHLAGGVEASQSYQREVLETVAETARRDGVGAVAATLRDTDSAGKGVYAVDGTPKTAQEALASVFEPVQVFLDGDEAVVVNGTASPAAVTLSWEAGEETGEEELTVGEAGRSHTPLDLPDEASEVVLTLAVRGSTIRNRYDR